TEAHRIFCLAWSPQWNILASASEDNTIRIWDAETGQQKRILEGHTDLINSVCFSHDGFFLASKSQDGSVHLWRIDTWEPIIILKEPASFAFSFIAFSPNTLILATL